jgi:hypothetical protein
MTININKIIPNQNSSNINASEPVASQPLVYSRRRIQSGLVFTLIGFLIFLLGARPSVFGLDRSPVIGFVQVAALLLGLGIICVGAYICIIGLWKNSPISIAAEIGLRMVSTGFVIAVISGMADVFGLGSHPLPKPFFGPWQALGVQIGELIIGFGILLMVPFFRLFPPKSTQIEEIKPAESNSEYQ